MWKVILSNNLHPGTSNPRAEHTAGHSTVGRTCEADNGCCGCCLLEGGKLARHFQVSAEGKCYHI